MNNLFTRNATAIITVAAIVLAPAVASARSSFGFIIGGQEIPSFSIQVPTPEPPKQEILPCPQRIKEASCMSRRTGTVPTASPLGLVDKRYRALYTAAPCGDDGAVVYNDRWEPIGVLHHTYKEWQQLLDKNSSDLWGRATYDAAYVSLYDNIPLGHNTYSPDSSMPPNRIFVGQQVCQYGQKSRAVSCGYAQDKNLLNVTDRVPSNLLAINTPIRNGDSGGPMWDRKTGAYIGTTNISFDAGGQKYTGTLISPYR